MIASLLLAPLLHLGIDPPPAPSRPAASIAWKASRPLRWSDFQGAVPENESHAAFTECTLTIKTTSTTTTTPERNGWWSAAVKLDRVSAEAVFQPMKSWVRPGAANDSLLAHEQIHFDLAHLQARASIGAIVLALGDTTFTARGPDEASALAAARSKYDREIERLTKAQHDALARRNREYDEHTSHGSKPAEQQRWSEMIARELRGIGEPRPPRDNPGTGAPSRERSRSGERSPSRDRPPS
ncbi:MAG: hypothetical protein FJ253_01990 [Phycisphaerae bacterium]|nr:hypothetical protein [Phycisphaerae bacterium]